MHKALFGVIVVTQLLNPVHAGDIQRTNAYPQSVTTKSDIGPLEAKPTPSKFPLRISLPLTFRDITDLFSHSLPSSEFAVYCNDADKIVFLAQIRGLDLEKKPEIGCVSFRVDESVQFDISTNRFSIEDEAFVESALKEQKLAPSTPKKYSPDAPQIKISAQTFLVRGFRVITVTYEGPMTIRSLYVAEKSKVWSVILVSGHSLPVSSAIWNALVDDL